MMLLMVSFNEELQTIDIGRHNMAASQKFRNVAAGSKVAFVVDDIPSVNPWTVHCLEIRGDAEALAEPKDQAGDLSGSIIRIHPRRILPVPAPASETTATAA
jgi:pyridoxamine 5'-phosphate oxidase family protein